MMTKDDARKRIKELEQFIDRPLPDKWRVGQRVRFLQDEEWTWRKGDIGTVVCVDERYTDRGADEYQSFTVKPDNKENVRWFTTPEDVELVMDPENERKR